MIQYIFIYLLYHITIYLCISLCISYAHNLKIPTVPQTLSSRNLDDSSNVSQNHKTELLVIVAVKYKTTL